MLLILSLLFLLALPSLLRRAFDKGLIRALPSACVIPGEAAASDTRFPGHPHARRAVITTRGKDGSPAHPCLFPFFHFYSKHLEPWFLYFLYHAVTETHGTIQPHVYTIMG